MKKYSVLFFAIVLMLVMTGGGPDREEPTFYKPVIYLYPEEMTQVDVALDLKGHFTCTYPKYADGWHAIAKPDGTLTNIADGKEYSYLCLLAAPNGTESL